MSPRSPTDPSRGDAWLGRYRVIAELARGGMAAVFLALGDLGRGPEVVAIKQIHAHLAHDPDFVAMLMDEARIVSMLKHPSVVEVVDYQLGDSGADNFIVMEYVAGEALSLVMRHAQQRGFHVGYSLAASVAADVAGALHAAHELRNARGELLDIVHRDVTPQNILVGWDGAVKLTDFGVAKAVGRLQRTQPGEIKGKLAYMAPEHAFGRPVDRRSDVYSLGVVLYELALNRRLFGGKTDAETIRNVMQGLVTPPRAIDPNFPPSLEEIILAMLAADPTQRFQTAGALERALRGFVRSAGQGDEVAQRGELVRQVDPARYQAKFDLIQRELVRGLGAPPGGSQPAAQSYSVKSVPPPRSSPPRASEPPPRPEPRRSEPPRSTEGPPFDKTFQRMPARPKTLPSPPAKASAGWSDPAPPQALDPLNVPTDRDPVARIAPTSSPPGPPAPQHNPLAAFDEGATLQADFSAALRAEMAQRAAASQGPPAYRGPPAYQGPPSGHVMPHGQGPEISPYVLGPTAPSAPPMTPWEPRPSAPTARSSRKTVLVVAIGVGVIVASLLIILDRIL